MDFSTVLRTLTEAPGVSGWETGAAQSAAELLKPYCDEVSCNARGSVLGRINGPGPLFLLDAHIDQIGLVVTELCPDGFVRFDRCGGVDIRTLGGLEVVIHGTEDVYGIIETVPPHLSNPEDKGRAKPCTELAIDTGLSEQHLRERAKLGDRVTFLSRFLELPNGQISAAALDDRAGVAVLIRTAEILEHRANLALTFSVQEEVAGNGAATALGHEVLSEKWDIPYTAIAVDVSFAWTPGCSRQETAELGKGPMLGCSPLLSHSVFEGIKQAAVEHGTPYQLEIMNGRTGTHADEIATSLGGVTTGLVSIPLKYMHTPAEVIATEDLENTARLLADYILDEGGRAV